jgi:hypothetical protein
MNVFKSHIKGFHRGGHSCSCCVESHSKQLTRRLARHRLTQADRVNLINAVDEEEDETFSDVLAGDWDPLHGFEVPDWTEDDEEEEDDQLHNDDPFVDNDWDDLFWLDELYLWSKYKAT